MAEQRKTVCNRDCPDACGIVATVEDGRVVRLQGDPDHPVTRGFLCERTSQFLRTQYGPGRLTAPLLRKNGRLIRVGWDEALDFAAERLLAIRAEHGPAAIFHYRSGGTLGLGTATATDLFFERLGPVTVKRGDICSGAGEAAQVLDFGVSDSHALADLRAARHILLWGKNVYTSSPHTLVVLRDARAEGTELVLVDPVWHRTANLCERFVQPRPGGDFALAMAVVRRLEARGGVAASAAERCEGLDELLALARSRSVEAWCAEADTPVEAADDLAARLADGPTAILVGWGMARRTNGGGIVRALDALSAISGNLGVHGGGASYYFQRRRGFVSPARGVSARTVCEPRLGPEVLAARDPPILAVWVTAGNPVAMLPESDTTARALGSRELLVVVDSVLTDTAALAHLVLPTTTLLEDDDLLGAYGHHYVGRARPVVPAPDGVRHDFDIMQAMWRRVRHAVAPLPAGEPDVLDGSLAELLESMIGPGLREAGLNLASLDQGAVKNPLADDVLFADTVPTPGGRVRLVTETPPALPAAPPGFPLRLMALSTPGSQSSQWARRPPYPLEATVHPDAAAGVPDGALAFLESRRAALQVRVRHDDRQRRDVALVPKGGHLRTGSCANVLIEARLTDLGEGGALYDEPVRITTAPTAPVAGPTPHDALPPS